MTTALIDDQCKKRGKKQKGWGGIGPFPANAHIAYKRVEQHREAIENTTIKSLKKWHKKRIREIEEVYPQDDRLEYNYPEYNYPQDDIIERNDIVLEEVAS